MLFLVAISAGLILAVAMMGFMFNRFLSHRARAQSDLDAQAVICASAINKGNRVGNLNEMEQASRELVFESREQCDKCQVSDSSFLSPLTYQLMLEAREGHNLLEKERQRTIETICTEINQSAQSFNEKNRNRSAAFCWPEAAGARIDSIQVGTIANTDSNIKDLSVIKELSEADEEKGYINSRSRLYRANLNAKLPNEGDLDFFISSLPANIDGISAPPRNANPESFLRSEVIFSDNQAGSCTPSQIPNAVQIQGSIKTSASNKVARLELLSTGVTGGDSNKSR